jgi:hypothetical protein
MPKLFLLKPAYADPNVGAAGQLYYCPHCAMVEGVLHYYPALRQQLAITYVDFPRPRKVIADLIGEANQSCPVLVLTPAEAQAADTSYFTPANGLLFVNTAAHIARFLAHRYQIALPHP